MFLFFSSYLVKMKGKISIHLKYTKDTNSFQTEFLSLEYMKQVTQNYIW